MTTTAIAATPRPIEKSEPMAETSRRRRANGETSRAKILDAATEIASERGYEGTSINLVSKRCGLPASSIYWHFTDKDDLIAAVIERSFGQWLSAWRMPDDGTARDRVAEMTMQVAKALLESPDFLRLGLMLALERRPVEPRAREMYLQVRAEAQVEFAKQPRSCRRISTRPLSINSPPTPWRAPTVCSSPRRSAVTLSIYQRCSNSTDAC